MKHCHYRIEVLINRMYNDNLKGHEKVVNNSTNINNPSPSWLTSLNLPMTYRMEIQVLAWDGHNKCSGLNLLMYTKHFLLDNW